MRKLISGLMILAITATTFAQERYSCGNPHPQDVINAKNAITVNGNIVDYNSTFASSQAINFQPNSLAVNSLQLNKFALATVTLKGSSTKFLARHNAISNEIEIKGKNDATVYNLNKFDGAVVRFDKTNESYRAVSYLNDKGEVQLDYFLSSTKNPKLLIRQEFKLQSAKVAITSYDISKPASYKESINYFYISSNGTLVNLLAKKKIIKKHFKSYEKEVLAYMKSNKINSNENDLAQLAGFINNLEIMDTTKGSLASNK